MTPHCDLCDLCPQMTLDNLFANMTQYHKTAHTVSPNELEPNFITTGINGTYDHISLFTVPLFNIPPFTVPLFNMSGSRSNVTTNIF